MKYGCLSIRHVAVLMSMAVSLTGCRNLNHTQRKALLGSGLGAAAGAIIGHQTGNRDKGALIGALAGGVGGGLLGNAQDKRVERDAALDHAYNQEQARRANQKAVTNSDIVDLTRNGVSDQIIISTIKDRGGRFDTSPGAIVYLKDSFVSDTVIQTMQRYNSVR